MTRAQAYALAKSHGQHVSLYHVDADYPTGPVYQFDADDGEQTIHIAVESTGRVSVDRDGSGCYDLVAG